jgi:hypothetical protein
LFLCDVYTEGRPSEGFRHPARMAPDQTVPGGENIFPIVPPTPSFSEVPEYSGDSPYEKITVKTVRGGDGGGGIELKSL